MPSLLGLKNSVVSALRNSHETNKPRLKRRAIPFNDAFKDLRASKTGFATCAAFHSFGRCRKEIALGDSSFLANLDQLNMADVQTPIKLMPLILCSNHWEKTIYYNALFLDWLSVHGSQHNKQYFENIVIDYQSAIAIENEEHSIPQILVSPVSTADLEKRPASAPCSPTRDGSYTDTPPTKDQSQIYIDHGKPGCLEPEFDPSEYRPQTSVLVNIESYASMEFGVAKLEILYQEKLRCTAMSSNGWRCPEIMSEEQLLKARELVISSAKSDAVLDTELLVRSVLCPGHALGQLPQIYSEKWTRFSEQRLSKDEAMSIFDADAWISVQFFHSEKSGQPSISREMRRPKSASNIYKSQNAEHREIQKRRFGRNSLWPPFKAPLDSQGQELQPGLPNHSVDPDSTAAARISGSNEVWPILLPKTASEDHQSTWPDKPETSTTTRRQMPGAVEPLSTSNSLEDKTSAVSNLEHTGTPAVLSAHLANLRIATNEPSQLGGNNSSSQETAVEEPMLSKCQAGARNDHLAKVLGPFAPKGAVQASTQSCSQDVIDRNLIKEIVSIYPPRNYVYIRKSVDKNRNTGRNLVIIGKGMGVLDFKDLNKARTGIGCQHQALDLIPVDLICVTNPERAVELVYKELENFQVKLDCQHQQSEATSYAGEMVHGRWFDIPEDVAIGSVRLWSTFIHEAYNPEGTTIKDTWRQMGTLLPKPSRSEIQSLEEGLLTGDEKSIALHHELRSSRYKQWIIDGQCSNMHMDQKIEGGEIYV